LGAVPDAQDPDLTSDQVSPGKSGPTLADGQKISSGCEHQLLDRLAGLAERSNKLACGGVEQVDSPAPIPRGNCPTLGRWGQPHIVLIPARDWEFTPGSRVPCPNPPVPARGDQPVPAGRGV